MMLVKGKTKLDESYNWLRATLIQGKQLSNNLEQKKKHIKELEDETEYLNK
jgi:cell division protein FtsB